MALKNNNILKTFSSKFGQTASLTQIVFLLIAVVLLTTVVNFYASAAITGKISGVITAEATNEPLANVAVTIVGTSTTATTNDAGYYVMTNIRPGGYDVKVELTGYTSETVEGAKVLAGLTTTSTSP